MHCVNYTRTCGSVSYLNPTSTKRTGKGHGRSGLSIDRGALKLLKGRVHDAGSFSIVRRKGSSFGIKAQEDEDAAERASFGYNRKDVILIGVALVAAGAGMYYGLQKIFGINALVAGNVVGISLQVCTPCTFHCSVLTNLKWHRSRLCLCCSCPWDG